MEDKKIEVCRLCLDIVTYKDVCFLDIVGRNMLEVIIPHLNLYISSDPKICHTCNKNMLTCYEFKSICDREFIKTDVKIEDIKVFQTKLEQKCNFCLSSIDDNEIDTSGQFYKEDLQQYLPKWILTRSMNAVSCKNCLETLKNQYTFLNGCLETEEKIKKYCLSEGTNSQGQVNLYQVLHFVLSNENKVVHDEALINNSISIKTEDIEIKSEEIPEEISTKTISTVLEQGLKEKDISFGPQEEDSSRSNEVLGFYKTSCFKACLVPTCVNNTLITSEKMFLTVPKDHRREGWCIAIEQGIGEKLHWQRDTSYYVCEDHFNLKEDMENYVYPYKLIYGKVFLKSSVVPHVFKCLDSKKRKIAFLEKPNKKSPKIIVTQNHSNNYDSNKRSIGIQVNLDILGKISVGTQVNSVVETRTIGTEVKPDLLEATTFTTQFVVSKGKRTLSKRKVYKVRK